MKATKKRNCMNCDFAEEIEEFKIAKTCTCMKSGSFGTDVTEHEVCDWHESEVE